MLIQDQVGEERFGDTQEHAAQHGSDHVADAAEHGGGEGLDAGEEAHVELDLF